MEEQAKRRHIMDLDDLLDDVGPIGDLETSPLERWLEEKEFEEKQKAFEEREKILIEKENIVENKMRELEEELEALKKEKENEKEIQEELEKEIEEEIVEVNSKEIVEVKDFIDLVESGCREKSLIFTLSPGVLFKILHGRCAVSLSRTQEGLITRVEGFGDPFKDIGTVFKVLDKSLVSSVVSLMVPVITPVSPIQKYGLVRASVNNGFIELSSGLYTFFKNYKEIIDVSYLREEIKWIEETKKWEVIE